MVCDTILKYKVRRDYSEKYLERQLFLISEVFDVAYSSLLCRSSRGR